MASNLQQTPSANYHTPTGPLSLGQAIQALPGQYLKVITRPSVSAFVEEKSKANWRIVWVQLIALSIIDAILQYLNLLISPPNVSNVASTSGLSTSTLQTVTVLTLVLFTLIFTPVSFFIGVGILHLIAKAFRGKGTFLQLLYVTLLFGVPMVILSYLLTFIPATSNWLPYLPHIYSIILFVFAVIAVHRRTAETK